MQSKKSYMDTFIQWDIIDHQITSLKYDRDKRTEEKDLIIQKQQDTMLTEEAKSDLEKI
jgi:hypothetical protein